MGDTTGTLRTAIERCYDAFADVPRPQRLDAPPYRNGPEILRTLTSAPLRQLSGEQVGPYSGWAMTTVGDEHAYRHFLPRILELAVTDPVWLGAEPPVIASKLELASWRNWPAQQASAIVEFFRAAFQYVIEQHPQDSVESADNWMCGLVMLGDAPAPLIETWMASRSHNAALQMASFIIDEAKHLRRHCEVRGAFWEDVSEQARIETARKLLSEEVRLFLESAIDGAAEEDRFYLIGSALAELVRQD